MSPRIGPNPPAPPLVALQCRGRTHIEPQPRRICNNLGKGGNIAQRQVEALPGNGMHAMGGIADKRKAVRNEGTRQMHVERPGPPRPHLRDGAQSVAETLLQLRKKGRIVERHDGAALRLLLGPGDAGALARQRKDRERPPGQEMLNARPS